MKELSLYIHIPFCISKCFYCDFSSFSNKNHLIEDYINALIRELKTYKEKIRDYQIKTIFIGGGTPSSIDSKFIYIILDYIYKNYNISKSMEVTIEINPGTLSKKSVEDYKKININRFSIGLQTLDDGLLKSIGRIHSSKDFYTSYNLLRDANINNINIDLILGLPHQSLGDVMATLDKVIGLKPEHISYYSLILEEGTILHQKHEQGQIILPSDELEREMYHKTREELIDKGYKHYEISNFALEGYDCKHNLVYWNLKPYLGVGLSSHSYFNGKRFFNTSNIKQYIEGTFMEEEETIDRNTEIEEFCILGLRKIEGIDKTEFKHRFNIDIENIYNDIIEKHTNNKLIFNEPNYIRLTNLGLDLANIVEVDFLI